MVVCHSDMLSPGLGCLSFGVVLLRTLGRKVYQGKELDFLHLVCFETIYVVYGIAVEWTVVMRSLRVGFELRFFY